MRAKGGDGFRSKRVCVCDTQLEATNNDIVLAVGMTTVDSWAYGERMYSELDANLISPLTDFFLSLLYCDEPTSHTAGLEQVSNLLP